ncbi:hypothetical protein LAZ67_18000035 [Cordylochernes scorpioides]|uniref:Aminopeptidase N-like N-terminal domain-containing protein n=1 Tax=Cordylochernes scorpioides TaxID=51811 RepID=A0ABY6LEK1_9ARAC|nr:hypothetical protein LAZ67_18000035 [Cordylochernes scorpioides]
MSQVSPPNNFPISGRTIRTTLAPVDNFHYIGAGAAILAALALTAVRCDLPTRLPLDLEPYHYKISVEPSLSSKNFTFKGHVVILFKCLKATSFIYLNAKNLEVSNDQHNISSSSTSLIEPKP